LKLTKWNKNRCPNGIWSRGNRTLELGSGDGGHGYYS
jgi:hypothetical protein